VQAADGRTRGWVASIGWAIAAGLVVGIASCAQGLLPNELAPLGELLDTAGICKAGNHIGPLPVLTVGLVTV
jgi:hypothetical protein